MLVGLYASLVIYVRNHRHVVGANQYMPQFQLWPKILRAKNTASSSKRFMCQRLWDSDHSPKVGMPSHTAHRPPVDASVVTTTRDVTKPRGTPGWRDFSGTASELRCSRGGPRCANGPKSTPSKWLEIQPNCSGRMCSKLSSLKRHREDKLAAERASPLLLVEAHSQIR